MKVRLVKKEYLDRKDRCRDPWPAEFIRRGRCYYFHAKPRRARFLEFFARQRREPQRIDGELRYYDVNAGVENHRDHLLDGSFYVWKDDLYFVPKEAYSHSEMQMLVKEYYFKRLQKSKRLQKEIQLF